ncbi:hypothetical protein FS837_001024 [Tulasnella sp. UAMH 9824]|nr:hypothetical protein FS837_001024 [Tulasnella sp. UAMH 9824]
MNTNVPPQTNTAREGVKPTPTAGYQEGYGSEQTPYANEMHEKHPMHPVTQGATTQESQFQDVKDPNLFRSERDDPGYNPNGNLNTLESGQHGEPPSRANAPFSHPNQGTTGYDANSGPAGYQHEGYGDQQQTRYANEFQEKQPIQSPTQGQPLQGNQFNDNANTAGFRAERDHAYAGTNANAVDAQQMPPNYEGHTGPTYHDQQYANEPTSASGPGPSPYKSGVAAGTGFAGDRDAAVAGNRFGDQYDHHKTATGAKTGSSWRTDPVGTLSTYMSHPTVTKTFNHSLSGGPFASGGPHISLEPTSREARHLKTSGKMEEMAGKMFGSESLQRRGQEKVALGRNMAVQVQDLKHAGKLEAKATKLRGKGGVTGNDGGVASGAPAGEFARGPTDQSGGMGPGANQGQFTRGY